MRFVFLAGGFAGFVTAGGASFWAGHAADRVLFDGAVGCLAAALLFRWFWGRLLRGVRETVEARTAAAAAAPAAPVPPAPPAKTK